MRDLAGFAGVERLLANDAGGEHHSLDTTDDTHADAIASSVAPRPQLGTGRPHSGPQTSRQERPDEGITQEFRGDDSARFDSENEKPSQVREQEC
jgi:hypothetical protein